MLLYEKGNVIYSFSVSIERDSQSLESKGIEMLRSRL